MVIQKHLVIENRGLLFPFAPRNGIAKSIHKGHGNPVRRGTYGHSLRKYTIHDISNSPEEPWIRMSWPRLIFWAR